jgi:hypothetical protein
MHSWPKGLLAGVALAALAACSPKGAGGAAAGGPDVTITPDQMPHVKAGYWQETYVSDNDPPKVDKVCSTGDLLLPGAFLPAGCPPAVIKRTGAGGVVIDVECPASDSNGASSMHTSVTGDLNASYVIDSHASTSMLKGAPPMVTTTHETFQYLGSTCPPG